MIFMGSEKYPDENEFNKLLTSNGGYSNAYTENEFTNYQFKVNYDKLEIALDMKANLLHKPILKEEAMMREIQAVDSEFEGNFPMDNVRAELILAESVTDKMHPCASFGWGNKKSLTEKGEDSLWQDLKTFFDTQYSAERMYIVVQTMVPDGKDLSEVK
jgi:nardilysin